MATIKIKDQEYEVSMITRPKELGWGNRESKEITIPMTYLEAKELFVDGLVWSVKIKQYDSSGGQIIIDKDMSDYALSGPITDNRDGTITIKMGKYTQEELLEISVASIPHNHQEAVQIQTVLKEAVQSLDDNSSLVVKKLYPTWEELSEKRFLAEQLNYKFQHNDKLYKTLQANFTFVPEWVPGVGTESIFVQIDENHMGTLEDPIPYSGNMVLEQGKYYIQDSVIYLCNRNTENAVYHALADLIGLYVEKI